MSNLKHQLSMDQLIRAAACAHLLKKLKSNFYNWINPQSPNFKADLPKKVRLSSRVIGWRLIQIHSWIQTKQQQDAGGSV